MIIVTDSSLLPLDASLRSNTWEEKRATRIQKNATPVPGPEIGHFLVGRTENKAVKWCLLAATKATNIPTVEPVPLSDEDG